MPDITRKQAESALAKAVSSFDWTQLTPGGEKFIDRYRTLHAQLRKGDKLKINARKIPGEYHDRYYTPDYLVFDIVLETSDGRRLLVTDESTPLYDCLGHPIDYNRFADEKPPQKLKPAAQLLQNHSVRAGNISEREPKHKYSPGPRPLHGEFT